MVRFVYCCVIGLLALLLQVMVVRMAIQSDGTDRLMLNLVALHVLAALTFGLFMSVSLRTLDPAERVWAFLHGFAVSLFLPVAGQVLLLSAMLAVPGARHNYAQADLVQSPQFVSYLVSRVRYGLVARVRARLRNRSISASDRMSAMVAMRSLPPHITGGLLRELLSDPVEEIRLLAYGISESAENALSQDILAVQQKWIEASNAAEKATFSRCLAELHWELVYQNLVHGEVRLYTLERVEHYVRETLAVDDGNAAMWWLLGRCALFRKQPCEAEEFLERARAHGFPEHRLLPWRAEAAFLQRDFRTVARVLQALKNSATPSTLEPVVRYWSS